MRNRFFYIFVPTKEQNMEAKIHFLAISDKDFSNLITNPKFFFIDTILKRYHWNHRPGYKFITPLLVPEDIIKNLDESNINYIYLFIPISL